MFKGGAIARVCGALFFLSLFLRADEAEPRWQVLNRAAGQAIRAKDYVKLRDTLVELGPLMPGNARIAYNLAAAEAYLGHRETALLQLNALVGGGLIYDFDRDDDFKSVRDTPDYASALRQVKQNGQAITSAVAVSDLPEDDLLPEDIAYDAQRKRFLIGSATKSKIITQDGRLFCKTEYPVMALRVDTRRQIIWAATGWIPHCQACDPSGKDKSLLVAYRLDTGGQFRRIESPVKGLLGDMTISRAGDLYLSEGLYGAVLRLKAGATSLERLDTPGEFPSPQTPALSPDERTLYVTDYVRGIASMDLKTRAVRWPQPASGIFLSGIDGFYRYRDSFLAVQNGVNPARLVLFSRGLKTQRILEANSPGLGQPTHGTFIGDTFYFIANIGWDVYDDDGKKKAGSAPVRSQIRKIDLRRCDRHP